MRSHTLLFLIALLTPLTAHAGKGLTFDSENKAVKTKAGDTKVTVPYTFTNTSQRTITIARWDSACSCLSARIKEGKMVYKPGDKGEIHIDFELGSFSGTQEKTVMLWTKDDSAQAPSSVLSVKISIPILFEISPKSLAWEQNGTKEPQTFKIKVHHDKPINITGNSGSNNNFPYIVKTIRKGWEYELTVTPGDVSTPTLGVIRVDTDAKIKRYQRQQAFVYVKAQKK